MNATNIIKDLKDVFDLATGETQFVNKVIESKKKEKIKDKTIASGNYSTAASSGDCSKAASSGNYSKAASSGDYSTAASSGDCSACAAVGFRAAVKGDDGNLIMATEYNKNNKPIGAAWGFIGKDGLKPDCWYIVEDCKFIEVDFTDNIFSYVLSTRNNVKKVKLTDGTINYIVTDGENFAHGKSIKEAREELVFKITDRDLSEYENLKPDTKVEFKESLQMYRAITGACKEGMKVFCKNNNIKQKSYKISEIIKLTKGQYGHDKFAEFFNK